MNWIFHADSVQQDANDSLIGFSFPKEELARPDWYLVLGGVAGYMAYSLDPHVRIDFEANSRELRIVVRKFEEDNHV